MSRLITQATKHQGNLQITISTETDPLFSFSVKSYSSPFLVEGGVKFLHVDHLSWHAETSKSKHKSDRIGYSNGDPAPIVLLENPELETITDDEIENLYEIVRYGRRAWPMGWAKIWLKDWLSKHQDLIGVDYFSHSDTSGSPSDEVMPMFYQDRNSK